MDISAATRRTFLTGAAVAVPLAASAANSAGPAGAGAAVAVPRAASAANSAGPAGAGGLLTGKTAVVYGAAGAMGGAVSRAFAKEGATVLLAGRTLERVEAVAAEIAAAGGRAFAARV